MRTLSKKVVSIFLSVVLVLGMFATILPTISLAALAQNAVTEYKYMEMLDSVPHDTGINDTRGWDVSNTTFGTDGLKPLGIWNAMGLDVAWGALGISHNFFNGTAVGAERDEIHPYIVYNVTPGTSFELSSAVHKNSKENESVLSFYVSNDGVTWIPVEAETSFSGIWQSLQETYDSYNNCVYTIANVGLKTNFVKVEYPMTMASRDDGSDPSSNLLVYGVKFTPVVDYAVNGQTLFEAKAFARQKELYEEHFIAYPDFVNMDTSVSANTSAATSNYGMLAGTTWGNFEEKDRSYIAMVAPGSHFYLETANNWYMKTIGAELVNRGELDSADQARIRVYTSATLSDENAWTEWDPMPYSCQDTHTPTFNFYLPEDHIYVRIVYPQKGNIASITKGGAAVVDTVGNDAAFFNDMVFTPYVKADADYTRDYTNGDSIWENVVSTSNLSTDATYGVAIPYTGDVNLVNDAAQNTGDPYERGHNSVVYEVEGGKMFNLEYASRIGTWTGNTKGCYEANVTDGSGMEFIIESSKDGSTWSNTYETESGYAETSNKTGNDCYVFDVSYLVPNDANYVRVSFGITGVGYLADNSTYCGFNDGLWIRKVSVADANNLHETVDKTNKVFVYDTDTDATKATETGNTETAAIDGATGFRGDYAYLVANDGNNVKTLAGTLSRPYVVYDVVPGSNFSFDYSMRATAKAASEATAALNVRGGLGNKNLKEFEFFVYGRYNENSAWKYIGKTKSDNLDYNGGDTSSYDTFGYGANSFTVPSNVNQIKVELPNTGAFTTATATTYDYTTMSGDFGGWNYNNLGAYDTYNGGNADCKIFATSGKGLGVHYGDAQGDWGTKSFYLIYAVQPGSTFLATFNIPDAATRNGYAEKTGEPFEFVVSSCATADGDYSNAVTTAGQGTNAVIGYRVPAGCNYVKVTFPTKGIIPEYNYVANDNTFMTGVSFYNPGVWVTAGNDAAHLYNVTYATGIFEDVEYEYATDTDATGANSTSNTETASIDGATGFRGDYGYLVAGDGNNVKTLAGTLERPYVIYDVIPGSAFSFDYSMYATAKAASEATAALNVKGGLGNAGLEEFEFFVYGRKDENSAWSYIGKTDSSALDYRGGDSASYGTNGYGKGSFTVPVNVTQVKVELPNSGAFTTATAQTYDYTTMSGDFGGWNYNNLGAFDTYNGGNANCKIFGNSGLGLGVHYTDAQGDWGTKSFYLIYAVQPNSTFVATFKMPDEGTRNGYAEKTGEPFEFVVSSCATWDGTYSNEVTTAGQGTDAVIGYRVPAGCNYVKVTFPTKGIIPEYNYVANDNTFMTGVSFYNNGAWVTAGNDAAHLYNVTYATGIKENVEYEYEYSTDTDTTGANSSVNTETGSINGATGFMGGYGHLVAGDGANVKTLAGTLERPYVIYDVFPGSNFNFEYAMRATAKAASEATAAMNITAGFGSEELRAYEYVVYGRADESSEWTYIGTTDSSALSFADGADTSSYDTFGTGAGNFVVPENVNQIKVELPGTGAFTTATPVSYDYTTMSGDFGGWNYNNLGAYDTYYGGNANCKIFGNSGLGLGVHYGDAQGDWGTKSFYLIYAVQPNSTFVATFNIPDEGTRNGYAEKTGEPFEFVVSACATADGTYDNAVTTAGQGTNAVIGYQVPAGCNYVKVTFPTKGIIPDYNYVANDNTFMTGVSFYAPGAWITAGNDASYLYNVYYAISAEEVTVDKDDDYEYEYTYGYSTDTDTTGANSSVNTETGSINGATGFMGGYGHLVAGDGANVKTLAGTLERPYVIYDVFPGSNFNFEYAMRATAKAASEATAALNIKGGFGNESLKEYEFFVYGRKDESSEWSYIGKTDSSALNYNGGDTTSYDTFGTGAGSFIVPENVNQIKVELPGTGAFTTATPVSYDYTNGFKDDFGGWNAKSALGAFDDYNGINANCKLVGHPGLGLGIHYSDAQGDWDTKSFYLIYAVQPNSTFVATFKMPDAGTRNGYAEKTGEPFEFVVSAAAEWNGTYSNEATTAGQGTDATIGYRVPAGCNYVKVTFPTKGIIPEYNYVANDNTFMTGVSFYNPGAWITAGNDAAYLYNVNYATSVTKTPIITPDSNYAEKEVTNISSSDKKALKIYNFFDISIVKGEGIVANSDEAFVTYKIKEDTMLILKSGCDLTFEYSVDDIDYKPFEAVKTCYGYVIPAIEGRNYIKVNLKNGESITKVDAEVLAPTAKFYIPYLDKYELVDYADYGVAANSVSSPELIRPGYTFTGWDGYNSEPVYIDTTFEATFEKDEEVGFTISYNDGEKTITDTYQFDDVVTITALATNAAGQKFSKWVDDKGVAISTDATYTFLVGGNLTLIAVYGDETVDLGAHLYANDEPIIKMNDDGTWNMSVVWRTAVPEGITVRETGILLGQELDKPNLILWDGETQANTYKLKHSNTDTNRTAMYTVKNIKAGRVRTALPYAVLSNGDTIYAEKVIRVEGGTLIKSAFEFNTNDALTNDTLSNYLDRAITYDIFGTVGDQTREDALYDTKDLLRQTNAKYLARGIAGEWGANISNHYNDNFDLYKNEIAELHEVDPELIIEACIFETCNASMNNIKIPAWVFEAFGKADENRNFNYEKMMHTWKKYGLVGDVYGYDMFGTGVHCPAIYQEEFQMFVYYRACTFIDMGAEAIHFGQMYRIGAKALSMGDVSEVDYESWAKVLDMITEYAETHARRGYVLFNGHNEDLHLVRAEDSNEMLVHFNMYPLRIEANGSDHTPSDSFQDVKLQSSGTAPYNNICKNVVSPLGDTYSDCYPYLLEFDNFGVDKEHIDEVYNEAQDTLWGYDEISWYINQNAIDRRSFLTTTVPEWITNTLPNSKGAANGHIAMPGKRTASVSSSGCSEYYTDATLKEKYYTPNIRNDANKEYAILPLWNIHWVDEVNNGEIKAIHDVWDAIGSFDGVDK